MKAPSAEFLVIDLPSDHQIENGLTTEGQLIATLLHERGLGDATRLEVVASKERFKSLAKTHHPDAKIVHIAAHADRDGLGAMGHDLTWDEVAHVLTQIVPSLEDAQEERVLVLSCCHSRAAYRHLKKLLRMHFTAVYYFSQDIVYFDVALMTWSMFYGQKNLRRPTSQIRKPINDFFGARRLKFRRI
ncbi:MAG: hypothetical protein JWP44_4540 [Mucilaginibacter sp.]|nr:hypothetical protein [Mucilaginibacter sp.]